jgi:GNAT superfamily N-acetyltransferase
VIVRHAQTGDMRAMVEFGRALHPKSPKACYVFDEAGATSLAGRCITEDRACAIVAEREGAIRALILGCVQRWPYLDAKFATDFLFVSTYPGAGRAVLRAFVEWARRCGADEVMITVGFGGKSATKEGLYEREGFERVGSRFTMNLRD